MSIKKYCYHPPIKACKLLAEDIRRCNIAICFVCETFLKEHIHPDSFVSIEGFQLWRRDRVVCKCRKSDCNALHKGGGVMLYISKLYTSDIVEKSNRRGVYVGTVANERQ